MAARFTRQQMMDMGLLPPPEVAQPEQQPSDGVIDGEEEEKEEAGDADFAEPDVIGLIGHFEASDLLIQKGKEGSFVGSLDMGMTTRELVSTGEGVGTTFDVVVLLASVWVRCASV